MKKCLILVILFSFIFVGCSKSENFPKYIYNLLEEQYVELDGISAFKNDNNISFYHTYWIIKIYDKLSLPIKHQDHIGRWISNIDITNESERDRIGLTGLPLEESIIMYLDALRVLKYPLEGTYKTKILSALDDLERENGAINDKNITIYSKLFGIYQLMDQPTDEKWFKSYFSYLVENVDKLSLFNKYYLYSYVDIDKEIFNKNNYTLTINNLDYKSIVDAYYINNMGEIWGEVSINRGFVSESFNQLINLDSTIDPQIMYYLITLDVDAISDEQKNKFSKRFNSLLIQNKAWGEISNVLSLDNTYFSLEILAYYDQLDELDLESINEFLNRKLTMLLEKDKLHLPDINNLRTLALSYKVIGNKEALNTIKGIIINKINNFEQHEINPMVIDAIITITIATELEYINLPNKIKNESERIINELSQQKNKTFLDIYYLYSLKKISGNWEPIDQEQLNKLINSFLDSKGAIINTNGEPIADTYYFIKLSKFLKMNYPEKTYNFLISFLNEESNENLIKLAIAASSIRIINEGEDYQ
ncbi:hypothetical protein [Paenibacillus sp. Y412MC10]|uniref:hypothetical protein n=1 Tax=Geobacillus sp. (strain Y412MC10) TaxID=481743 RepID=UPI000178968A|nr:hypothetical protein [Paenibacillus sp. Y412MC10]ACX63377.1 hypothetical protein GYMC10_1086 [Paenibacillus sp. Y412MC10]